MYMKFVSKKTRAVISGFACAFFVGFSFLLTKQMVVESDFFLALVWRFNSAFIFLICFFIVDKIFKLNLLNITKKQFKYGMLPSSFYVLFMSLQALGLTYASSIESSIAFCIIPIFTVILSIFFLREKITLRGLFCIALSIIPLIFLIILRTDIKGFNMLSMLILILSSLCLSATHICMRKFKAIIPPIQMPCFFIFTGFVVMLVLSICKIFLSADPVITLSQYIAPIMSPTYVLSGFYLGIFCIFLSATFLTYMNSILPSYQSSIFGNMSIVISIIIGVLILQEQLLLVEIPLIMLIIIGVIGLNLQSKTKK